MMFLFRRHPAVSSLQRQARSGMLLFSILCIAFGLMVFAAPELLAYIVASFFLVVGISSLITWWKLK